jgi:aminopeptidase N
MLAPSLLVSAFAWTITAASPVVDHDLDVAIDTSKKRIEVIDKITLDAERTVVELMLHAGLAPSIDGASNVEVTPLPPGGAVPSELVRATFAKPTRKLTLKYAGVIDHAPAQVATEHQRSFQETPGTIASEGVYLSAASLWVARVVDGGPGRRLDELVTVKMRVKGLPKGWRALTEGDPAGDNAWISTTPSDDVHLVAGPFVEVKERKRGVDVRIWLRAGPDGALPADGAALAQRYIEVTGQYLGMYNDLIGTYPYGKFALVENFWETGYGMPSFTLLGPQVVRFPFILHTSWPHELLHNWWGNGVFVKPDTGNWSEGLTAYLADHLHAEHEGKSDEYRRTTLQKYQDFVSVDASLDFALETFGSRFSSASEAVGYGKWLMVVHMLRKKVGDDAFARALKRFWREHRFERATFDDFRVAVQAEAGADAKWVESFLEAWIKRTGAPRIAWRDVRAQGARGSLRVDVVLEQTQTSAPFPLDVPVVVTLSDGRVVTSSVPFDGTARSARVSVPVPSPAARVDIDPFVDTFRALLPGETAPSLSRALGAKKSVFVLPTLALPEERTAWTAFARSMCATCKIVDDKALDTLPVDGSTWILGYGNQLRGGAAAGVVRYGARFDDVGFLPPGTWTRERLKAERTEPGKTSLVLALPSPRHPSHALVFVGAHKHAAIPLLARKIPHYGKYGYLGFSGDAAENSLKGQWTPDTLPLTVFLNAKSRPQLGAKQPPALAKLPPPFDADRMLVDVKALAAMNGRGNGTKDLDEALAYVLARLPSGANKACDAANKALCNVVATLPGSDRALAPVVVGAHVDHLGKVRGKVHPGADDNASGVAVLIEVARALAKQGPFARDVMFVAFSGEEDGLQGSRSFVKSMTNKAHSMVNLDVVGRRAPGGKMLVLDGASASEWVHIVRGVGFTTGVAAELAKEGGGASDQQAFIEAGVPAIQLFSGPNADYHKATDTADKVDGASLVDAAVMTREIAAYLADRKEPLSAAGGAPGSGATGGRRVSLGTVPDMTFTGPGVKVDDVVAGSPAASAGLMKGDVLVKFDGAAVNDLRGYSELLKTKKPGDKVKVVVVRGGKEVALEATLVER